jgi:hypothetical protein
MRMSKMFGLAVVAMLIIGGLATASAFAVEAEFTPAPNVIKEVKSGAGELSGGSLPVNCTSDEGGEAGGKGGTVSAAKKGTYDVLFLGCSAAGGLVKCTGLEDTTVGSILSKGEFEPVYVLKEGGTTGDEDPAIVFFTKTVHFSCGTTLAVVTGSACGLVTPANKKVKVGEHYTVTLEGNKSKETYSKVKNATTGLLKCQLFEEENEKPETKKQAFEKTTEEVFLEKESELKA